MSTMLVESILLFRESGLWPLWDFRRNDFGRVSFGREQGLNLALSCHGVVIFIQHLVLFDPRLVTLLTCLGRGCFLPPPRYNFAGVDLFFICAESGWFFLVLVNIHDRFFDGQFSAPLPFWWRLLQHIEHI